jgi:hypothetical protein
MAEEETSDDEEINLYKKFLLCRNDFLAKKTE